MAIRRSDRRRLARLAMPLVYARRHAVERRVELRGSVAFYEYLGDLLLFEDIDPESTCVMRDLREVEAALAAIPDTPELRQADEDYLARTDTSWVDQEWERGRRYRAPPRAEKTFKGEVERLIGRYRTDVTDQDHAKASPMELLAWCLSRHGATIDEAADDIAKAAEDLQLVLDQLPEDATPEDIERALFAEEKSMRAAPLGKTAREIVTTFPRIFAADSLQMQQTRRVLSTFGCSATSWTAGSRQLVLLSNSPHPGPLPASGERESGGDLAADLRNNIARCFNRVPSPRLRGEGQGEGQVPLNGSAA
jgi:hypothetical protein